MKKFLIVLMAVVLVLCLVGCKGEKITTWKVCGYIEKKGDIDLTVYYDENTKVMYASSGYGKTLLLNSDGTPMLYKGDE